MPRLLAILAAVAILLVGVIQCIPLLREKAVQRRTQLELLEQLQAEEARSHELAHRIHLVKTDRATVERLAREKFGLARPGEIIFKFRGDWPAGTPANGNQPMLERGR